MGIPARIVLGLALVLLGGACRSPQQRVDRQMSSLRVEWRSSLLHQAALPERVLDWSAALDQMRQGNLKLRQARVDLTNSHEAVRQIFRDLTPTLNARAGLTKSIEDIPSATVDDVTFSLDSFFNIPGFVSFGARLYAARLFELRSRTAYALVEREQIIDLYKLFWSAQISQAQGAHLENQKRTAVAFQEVDPFSGQLLSTELQLQEIAERREWESLQQRAGDLLGDRSWRWVFVTNGLPELRYASEPLNLADTNTVAQLQMKLVAIELEAARVQLLGMKLRYWPELSIFVTGPPIYQRAFGQERFWDAAQLRASADLFWHLDTRGQIARQLRQTRRQQALQRERLRQETLGLMDRLLFTQNLLTATQDQIRQIDLQLRIMQAVPPAQNFLSLQSYATDYRTLVERQRALLREQAELNTLFWFVDERAWNDPAGRLAAAR
jgi:hypothetical protein